MDEDIEIFRRLLNRALRGAYHLQDRTATIHFDTTTLDGTGTSDLTGRVGDFFHIHGQLQGSLTRRADAWFVHDPHIGLMLPAAEGVYLPGHGVVYQMTLPPPGKDPRPGSSQPAPKQLSPWEQARRELHGEPLKPDENAPARPAPSLADAVLKALADNGHHFTHLPENERLTVAITFRGLSFTQQCMACHSPAGTGMSIGMDAGMTGGTATGSFDPFGNPSRGGNAGSSSPGAPDPAAGGDKGSPNVLPGHTHQPGSDAASPGGSPLYNRTTLRQHQTTGSSDIGSGTSTSVRDYELLGDLHLKQGRAKEALEAYQKVLLPFEAKWGWGTAGEITQAKDLYNKMIQAHLQLKDFEGAQQVLQKALKVPKTPNQRPEKPATGAVGSAPAALPSKLIVSAPKRLLDQVGGGKLGFEDFKKAATVEYLTSAGPEKKPTTDKQQGK
jgi:hypothetical protein